MGGDGGTDGGGESSWMQSTVSCPGTGCLTEKECRMRSFMRMFLSKYCWISGETTG